MVDDQQDGSGPFSGVQGRRLRVGVLLSGGGRTLENLAQLERQGEIPTEIVVAISSHRDVAGIERAKRFGIPCHIMDFREYGQEFVPAITRELEQAGVDLVLMAGFIRHYPVPQCFRDRILNIHPALLPSFGGRGFYGSRVHQAVIDAGVKFSGCTVHFVSDEYDSGPILVQRVVPVLPEDTPDSLAARVFEEECIAYPEAIRIVASGRVRVVDGRTMLAPE